jgi:hypothetical protein
MHPFGRKKERRITEQQIDRWSSKTEGLEVKSLVKMLRESKQENLTVEVSEGFF